MFLVQFLIMRNDGDCIVREIEERSEKYLMRFLKSKISANAYASTHTEIVIEISQACVRNETKTRKD